MRLDSTHKHGNKDESEEDEYALSENWTFEQKNRRWSRVCETDLNIPANLFDNKEKTSPSINSSTENLDTNNADGIGFSTLPHGTSFSSNENEQLPVRFRRTGSERLKDGAKAFLRRVESIKSRRRKKQNRDGVIISGGPETLDLDDINIKLANLKCVDINKTKSTPPSPIPTSPSPYSISTKSPLINNNDLLMVTDYIKYQNQNRLSPNHCLGRKTQMSKSNRTSPLHFFSHSANVTLDFNKSGDDTSSYYSDASQESSGGGGGGGGGSGTKKRPSKTKSFLQKGRVEDIGAMSDSECHQFRSRKFRQLGDASAQPSDQTPKPSKLLRGGSLNFGKESRRYRDAFNSRSFRSRSSTRRNDETKASTVVRWHSFQSGDRPDNIFKKCQTPKAQEIDGIPLAAMSCGQLQVVRKLALVTLTGYMERYCPTHRSGWNWELPKFIKKIKSPDYKDKKVFGVPFLLLLQRTGETLPKSIQSALKWLKLNAMHQIGIFRKSGVKSRIQKLKTVVEESPVVSISLYDIQQAYDVADMVKQYFRELPDTLLTAKMSETFVAIFQHLPPEVRPDACQSAVLLLPDEHREVLQHLLEFLNNVADNAAYNQMTANNLAVCLAPSLFYNGATSMSSNNFRIPASPRRRKPTGVPDPRELSETRASHECLTYLIENYRTVFTISNEKIIRCNFGYMEESRPVPLEVLGEGLQVHDWRGYLYECTSATIKEGREKSRGWISTSSPDPNVEIAFKKVGDGHPLRLWKFTTELDGPPSQVLQYVFKERHHWDQHLLKWRIIEQLDERSEIFQYATGGQTITDYCVLRSWRSDLPRGACVIVETSVEHAQASLLLGGVRGVVLASRYLIEPVGNGRSKIMHLSRVDIKGKTPEWYNKTYGHVCSHHLARIRNNFKRAIEET
ncbi:hypothetical protein HA402_006320 [Bradysia odoriphaga]|nr:hypothetical protein HA402_006320 [Bradysia odoriphaga]